MTLNLAISALVLGGLGGFVSLVLRFYKANRLRDETFTWTKGFPSILRGALASLVAAGIASLYPDSESAKLFFVPMVQFLVGLAGDVAFKSAIEGTLAGRTPGEILETLVKHVIELFRREDDSERYESKGYQSEKRSTKGRS